MPDTSLRIAMLSLHSSPLASLGGETAGGMNVYVREASLELGRLGHRVDIFTRRDERGQPEVSELSDGVRLIRVKGGPSRPCPREELPRYLPELRQALRAFSERPPYDIVHAHYWLSGMVGLDWTEGHGVPLVQMFHTLERVKNRVLSSQPEKESDFRIQKELVLGKSADAIVAGSEEDRTHLIKDYGVKPGRVHIIPGGVDLQLFSPQPKRLARSRVGFGRGPVALFVGRMEPVKGVETLLHALALVGNGSANGNGLCLALIGGANGPNPYLRHLEDLARTLGVSEHLEFLGPRSHAELPDYYSAADCCVFPSLYESFGLAALEAVSCGAEVVASDTGGFRQTLGQAKCALLVPPGDAQSLARAIHRAIAKPCSRRGLREKAVKNFTWARAASRLAKLYKDLLHG